MNRRKLERQLVVLAAARPDLALAHADALASVQYHDALAATIAASMLDILAENPLASASDILSAAVRDDMRAANLLSRGLPAVEDVEALASYLVEELSIGDAEEAVAQLRAQLAATDATDAETYEMLYEAVAALQRDITARRQAQRAAVSHG